MELIQYFINNYSTHNVLFMFLICFGAISLFCSWILKNYFPKAIIHDAEGNAAASILFSMFTGFYALLLAFIIVMLWGGISENQQLIFEESSELAILTRLGATVEQPPANQIKPAIKQYIHDVVGIEWQNFKKGVSGKATEKALNDLYAAVLGLSPKSFQERIAYKEMVQVIGKLVVTHRNRVASATGKTLPDIILYTALLGGLIISILITQIGGIHRGQQYLLHLIVSIFIAINVGLIFVMNVPYSLNICNYSAPRSG